MIPFKTKIVATLGPSSSNEQVIKTLMMEGARIFRLNFSHGQQDTHLTNIELIRSISEKIGIATTIIADLCGPKIRVGSFIDGKIQLQKGDTITLDTNPCMGTNNLIHSQYQMLAQEVSFGTRILLDDGLLEFKVLEKTETQVKAEVIRGGILKNNKGMNLPGLALSVPALMDKDKKDVDFSLKEGSAIAPALFLQSLLFAHGGFLSLGLNICVMTIPALFISHFAKIIG